MIPIRSVGVSGSSQAQGPSSNLNSKGIDSSQSVGISQILQGGASASTNNSTQMNKKSLSKQRAGGAATAQGMTSSTGTGAFQNINTSGSLAASSSAHRGSEGSNAAPNVSILMQQHHMHNQTAKIPQHYLNSNTNTNMKNPAAIMMAPNNMTAALSAVGVPPHSSMSMNNNDKLNLSTSQKKRISLKKLEEEYCKTIEQIGSPNSSTLNLENMKKTQSLHYMRAGSGASSPQQIKSRTSIGKYGQQVQGANSALGGQMGIYNNYNHQQQQQVLNPQQRNSFVSKSQIGGGGVIGQIPPGTAMGTGNRSRSKTTNRKKRNLYTSMGNYYQSQQPSANVNNQANNNSASRVNKRVHQQNFLNNLEQTNMIIGGNLAAAHHQLIQEELMTKKRNKSSTKSYNNKEMIDHNNSSEICYSSHITKKNPLTNNFFDVSQFSSNHNSIAKNFENSFQFTAGGFLPNSGKQTAVPPNLSAVSGNKQRPTSSHKSTLMGASVVSSTIKPVQKKKAQGLRKSVNNMMPPGSNSTHYNSNNLMNSSANYGQNNQNAYDFLSNTSLILNSSKAARRPTKGGNSVIDSRCSTNKDSHVNTLGLVKSQVASNTAFGHHQQLNNTSHTTICSNRKTGLPGEIVSGKKNSLQQQLLHQNYVSLAGGQHTSDILTAGEISSDRQTLKMNDFLKQIEAYSNDKLDKFMPQMTTNNNGGATTFNFSQQLKIAEQVKNLIEREMQSMHNPVGANSSKQRYDESRGGESGIDRHEGTDDEQNDETLGQAQPDYEHLLNVISDSFNSLISTFYQNVPTAVIGVSLARIKESYEEIINSIVENLSTQIESHQGEIDALAEENSLLKERNAQLEKNAESSDQSNKNAQSLVKHNEILSEELNRVIEENKALKKESKDRDSQLVESKKMIEKLSQKQLHSQSQINHNSSATSKTAARQALMNESNMQQSSKGLGGKASTTSVPPLDLGKLNKIQQSIPQPMMSNDSLQTLDKALLNANLQDPSQSSVMNTVNHHDNSRMLEELYSNHHQQQQPFNVNQSDISYVNSEDGDHDVEVQYLNSGNPSHQIPGQFSQSGRLSSIAQDKSPIMKPFIPPLNLNGLGLNNRTQAAKQGQPVQMQQQQPPQNVKTNPKLKLDLSGVSNQQQNHTQQLNKSQHLNNQDQDSSSLDRPQQLQQKVPMPNNTAPPQKLGGLGLNLANLKQQRGIVDFQDEFCAKYDEFSESWRNAMNREKRF